MTPARFRWGTILITIGLLILLRNLGILNDDVWIELAMYFPLVLIAIGIEKIFTRTRAQFLAYMSSVLLMGAALFLAFSSSTASGGFFSETTHRIEDIGKVKRLQAELKLNDTHLTIRDSGRDLVFGRFDRYTRKPRIEYAVEGNTGKLSYTARQNSYFGGALKINTGEGQDWYVRFNEEIPISLKCTGDETDVHLNLSTTVLEQLDLDLIDSEIYVKLGNLTSRTKVHVRGDGSSLKLRVPSDAGLRVKGESNGSLFQRIGLIPDGEDFVSPHYDFATSRIDVQFDDRLSSLSIDFF